MWTSNERYLLISLYPNHSDEELCDILRKTPEQIRGIKERLGLNSEFNVFTAIGTNIIRAKYTDILKRFMAKVQNLERLRT